MALETPQDSLDYHRVAKAIRFLEGHWEEQPDLERVADAIGLSPYHCQRLFTRWAGVSPKRFLGYLTVRHAKGLLRQDSSVLDTAYAVGLSGPGRLHDTFVAHEAMTPGEYKREGAGMVLRWGMHESPFGRCLLVVSDRGIVALAFTDDDGADVLAGVQDEWPLSRLREDSAGTGALVERCFGGGTPSEPVRLLLRGTNFQVKVWEALLDVPAGQATTYGRLAADIGKPGAARAVGSACGLNRIAFVVPCHRVIRESGALGGYRWGLVRKRAMLAWEAAHTSAAEAA